MLTDVFKTIINKPFKKSFYIIFTKIKKMLKY